MKSVHGQLYTPVTCMLKGTMLTGQEIGLHPYAPPVAPGTEKCLARSDNADPLDNYQITRPLNELRKRVYR